MPAAPGKHRIHPIRDRTTKHRPRERRGTAHERGYSRRWARFRQTFLSRHPLCEYCLADDRIVPATVVDHDLPHRGDKELFWQNTFSALCARHHNGEKARMEARLDGEALLDWVRRRKKLERSSG